MHVGDRRAPRRWKQIQKVNRGAREKEDVGGVEGLDALFACPVHVREMLDVE